MTTGIAQTAERRTSTRTNGRLQVALPEPSLSMTQDAEWCVVRVDEAEDHHGLEEITLRTLVSRRQRR